MMRSLIAVAPLLLLTMVALLASTSALKRPSFLQRKKYTPLLFFTLPKDTSPECDAMEACVSKVEKDLGVSNNRALY
jgi:hypothetical protein